MYCEDIDLCRRLRAAGYELVFEPAAVVEHEGGASAPRAQLLPGAGRESDALCDEAPRPAVTRCSSAAGSRSAR